MDEIYRKVCFSASKQITNKYSTSFAIGVRCLNREIRDAVYAVYGFVRIADEIVDTFHDQDKDALLSEFEQEYYRALERGLSTNPVINSFQATARKYEIGNELVGAFLRSMRMDIDHTRYERHEIGDYIYGSAEVVGLMCLKIFVRGDQQQYRRLEPFARKLGAAFQKVNFLRDLKNDTTNLHRVYFPILETEPLNEQTKKIIIEDIYSDYKEAEKGIRELPDTARLGVYTAYLYYLALTKAIEKTPAQMLLTKRIRVSNRRKAWLLGIACCTQKYI